jgi:hypothetical protein
MRFSALIPFALILPLASLATPLPFPPEFQAPLQNAHNLISQSLDSAAQSLDSLGLGDNASPIFARAYYTLVVQVYTEMKNQFEKKQDANKDTYAHTLDCCTTDITIVLAVYCPS